MLESSSLNTKVIISLRQRLKISTGSKSLANNNIHGHILDRLVKEMRLAGVKTLDEANRFLEGYCKVHNQTVGLGDM